MQKKQQQGSSTSTEDLETTLNKIGELVQDGQHEVEPNSLILIRKQLAGQLFYLTAIISQNQNKLNSLNGDYEQKRQKLKYNYLLNGETAARADARSRAETSSLYKEWQMQEALVTNLKKYYSSASEMINSISQQVAYLRDELNRSMQ